MSAMFVGMSMLATQIVGTAIVGTSSPLIEGDGQRGWVPEHIDRGYLRPAEVEVAAAAVTIGKHLDLFGDHDAGSASLVLRELEQLAATAPEFSAADVWF